MGNLGELVLSMSADVARLKSDMGSASSAVKQACSEMVAAGKMAMTALSGIGGALAGFASISGIQKAIDASHKFTDEAHNLTLALGGTLENASVLNIALKEIGLTSDDYTNMVFKMDRQLKTHADLFDTLKIKTKDANGQLLDQKTIMDNAIRVMLSFGAGTDRNLVSTTLFGRSAQSAAEFLRLNADQMAHAEEVARKLGLTIDEHGVASMHKYQESIADAKLALTSMAQVLEGILGPIITKAAINFSTNIGIMESAVRKIKNLILNGGWDAQVIHPPKTEGGDAKLTAGQLDKLSGGKGAKDAEKATREAERLANAQISAHNSYVAYLKVYDETVAQMQKEANATEEQANQIAYNWGLVGLKDYLDKKHALNENSLQVELDAKRKELSDAQAAEKSAEAASAAHPDSWSLAEKVNKSYETTQKAIMAVDAAEAKLNQARVSNADEFARGMRDESNEILNLIAQVADLAGEYGKAAQARVDFYHNTDAYRKLTADQKEQQDIIDKFSVFSAGQQQASGNRAFQSGNQGVANKIPDIFGRMAEPQAELKRQYEEQKAVVQDALDAMDQLQEKDEDKYAAYLKRKELLTEQYNANKKRLDVESGENTASIIGGQLGTLAGMMDKGNRDQFNAWKALAIGEAIIAGALAFNKAMASGENIYVGMALAGMTAAITAIQVGIIAGQQYQGRELGGSVNANTPYIVGEKGPELFTPGASGMITANNKLGGVNVTQHVTIDARGADQGVEQRINNAMAKAQANTESSIFYSMQRGGKFAYASGRMK